VFEGRGFGRFAEPARLVLDALRDGPRQHVRLFDEVRVLDGPVGPGTLYAAVARLERLGLIEPITSGGRRAYRLTGSTPTGDLVTTTQGGRP
jgi:DNA-binding PadR family transcriptional regulator